MVMRRVVWSSFGRWVPYAALALLTLAASDPAQARYRRFFYRHPVVYHHRSVATTPTVRSPLGAGVGPNYAAMVVDANSGRTLYAVNEDAPRHPASITKVMTLYLLFEQLDKGAMRLDTPLTVSSHAAEQAPTKLGLRPGSTILVENAIKAIVTKSANDMAVTVAENIAGDESTFAETMTRKARALGMAHTTYVNASGLPDMRQITTARDLTILGRAIRERFPRYYHYFSTPSFTYAGSFMANHNHLMSRVDGMDGIKTGYTTASGFNLLSSVNRDGRHIVSVVLGGRTAASRDRVMETLIEGHIEEASATPSTHIAEAAPVEEAAETPSRTLSAPPVDRQPPRRPTDLAQRDDEAASQDMLARQSATRVSFSARDTSDEAPVERHPPAGPNLIAPDMALPPAFIAPRYGQAQRQAEMDRDEVQEREAELARQAERARQAEADKLRQAEADKLRQAEADKLRQAEADAMDAQRSRSAGPRTVATKVGEKVRPAFIAGAPRSLEPQTLPGPLGAAERRRLATDGSTNRRAIVDTTAGAVATATPSSLRWVTGPQPAKYGPKGAEPRTSPSADARTEPGTTGSIDRAPTLEETRIAKADLHPADVPPPRGSWVIQIGATDGLEQANELLSRAKAEGRSSLASARPFTEKVQKGESTLYRARFAGLDPNEAEMACRTLKRSGFACFATHN